MKRRKTKTTQKIIYDKLIKASSTVTSLDELSKVTGISHANIREAFKNHPDEYEEIKKNFLRNAKQKQKDNKTLEKNAEIRYVIDTSISNTPGLKDRITRICSEPNSKIILTSTTVKELVSLNKHKDDAGMDAKYILRIAAENPEKFDPVLIDENHEKADDAIIAYCAENKDEVVLLTGDREMTLFARMYGVKTEYIKHAEKVSNTKKGKYSGFIQNVLPSKSTNASKTEEKNEEIKTLKCAKFQNDNLFLTCGFNNDKAIAVYSNGRIYRDRGVKKLEIGDEVFIAKRHDEGKYSTFSNFVVTKIAYSDNTILKYSNRVYQISKIEQTLKVDKRYVNFMKKFLEADTKNI